MDTRRWKVRMQAWQGNQAIERDLSGYYGRLQDIDEAGLPMSGVTDAALKQQAGHLRRRVDDGDRLEDVLIDFFALSREAAGRVLQMRPFDVQMLAGLVLLDGKVIEMKTGEGKTLAAVFPAALQALTRKGVHILTFNDYLARRDALWMKPLYDFLGISVAYIQEGQSIDQRKKAYAADVTYATAKEAGFDFLRMHLARYPEERAHRGFHYAIIDEADSILIDEARVPLVIAGERHVSDTDPYRVARVIEGLTPDLDWETDEHRRNVLLTESGTNRVEAALRCGNLHADENNLLLAEVNQALHARALLHRDVDYIVRDGRIEVVDEFTGRVMDDRRWPDGLQAALEAKEGLPVRPGGRILGSITLQHYLKQYDLLAGMTATAESAAEEIAAFYGLPVAPIPPNRPCIREDLPALIFTHRAAKYEALVREIHACYRQSRPVLVGTGSVAESEYVAERLRMIEVPCEVLNAKNDEVEAQIVAKAGEPGAVTISTNMAGRGTDIRLGGVDGARRAEVVACGGLLVIGTTLHESRRIDDQLRGRAGRQGDPGASKLYVSLEDDLLVRFGIGELIPPALRPAGLNDPIDLPLIRREVKRVQRIAEGQNFEIRKTLRRYAALLEEQRRAIHDWRVRVLEGKADLPLFKDALPDRYAQVVRKTNPQTAYEAEQAITLHYIDACWAEHLALVSELREGIHLVGIGGLNPLNEFHKQLAEAFWKLLEEIETRVVESLKCIEITDTGIRLETGVVQGPSATWTYLINDRALTDLHNMLFGQGNSAFAAAAALMTWPLLLAWGIWRRWKGRGKSV